MYFVVVVVIAVLVVCLFVFDFVIVCCCLFLLWLLLLSSIQWGFSELSGFPPSKQTNTSKFQFDGCRVLSVQTEICWLTGENLLHVLKQYKAEKNLSYEVVCSRASLITMHFEVGTDFQATVLTAA